MSSSFRTRVLWLTLVFLIGSPLGTGCEQSALLSEDVDLDGVPNKYDSNDEDPKQCYDHDADGCDDCNNGPPSHSNDAKPDPSGASDGDFDDDGLCDLGDNDDDNDSIVDSDDPVDFDPARCGDSDHDSCDDCSVHPGTPRT